MSLSAAIDTLNKSFQFLAFDQIVEMCFVCSLLNTPLRFHHVMECRLLKKAESGEWSFQKHPIYDWLEMSMQTFGAWQGGPFSRYSPVGIGNIAKECFGGMQHDLTEVESSDGKRRLAQVVQILCKFIEWVNSLSRRITVTALPVPFLREKMLETCAAIKDVVPSIEFKIFRLGIFLTHANGCRLTQSGIHLRNLFFPAAGMASCKHLKEARGDIMEYDLSMSLAHVGRKRKINEVADDDHATDTSGQDISEDNFDEAMKAASEQFGGAVGYICQRYLGGGDMRKQILP
eukprot:scaffold589_cov74-Cylindrotheca_fusiformis.AAC.1